MNLRKLAACCVLTALAAAAQDRILQPVDRTRMTPLKGHIHPQAVPANDQGPVDPAMPIRHATLLLKPAASVEAFLADQQLPRLSQLPQVAHSRTIRRPLRPHRQ